MNKLLMVMVLGASAVAASAQGLQPRRTLGSRLARPRPQTTEGIVGKKAIKVIPTAREGGATWKYKESDKPLANWADLSFDDKDWQEGVSGFGNSYGLRRTAWSGGANDLYLRKTFSMSSTTGQIERVTLTYAIDDDIEVLLNGSQLFSLKARRAAKYGFTDVTKEFKRLLRDSGQDNVLAVKAHDVGGGAYVDVGVDIVLADSASVPKKDASVSAEKSAETQGVARVSEIALIPFGATEWKYKMQGEVEENWKSPDFNDASWAKGKTPFGNDTWTTPCICLRKKFDCPYEDADIKYLQIREGIDDVLDIWLNGSHIFHWTYHGNSDLTTVVPRKLWEGLLRRRDNVLTVLARDWGGGRFVNVGLTAMVRQSVGRELVCPTEYVPADMKLIFPATKLADIQVCSAVLTGDAVNWGRPTAVLASNAKSVGDVRKTLQFQRLENNVLKCACVELEQKGRDVWGRVLYCRRVNHCDVSCADFDTLLGPTHRVIDNDSEVANGSRGDGFALKEFTVYFASGVDCNGACTGTSTGLRRPGGLLGGSLRARRLQRQQEAQAAAAKQQTEVAAEKAQREAERAEQRRQLAAINEELKKVREQKAAAAKSECAASCITNKPTSGKGVVAEKLGQCDFLLNKDFKKNAKFYLCLFSASWCGPCRREMPRIAKTYAETLKDDPDIELIHFSRDQNDEKALAWAKEHDVKFPVVKPRGGNPLDLHSRGIPHLFIVKADGTVLEEGHPMRIFNEEKFRELKSK